MEDGPDHYFPSHEGMLHSKFSEKLDVTNITGMANPEIDKLIDEYNMNWNMNDEGSNSSKN